MRLFTAIDLPDGFQDEVAALQAPSALDARWTDPDQFHVTLRFIGDANAEQTARYEQALADMTAPPARCKPYGLDVLPSRRSPRVLVLGLERTASLVALYEAVSGALEREGLSLEDRDYTPHITLARVDDTASETVHAFLRTLNAHSFPAFRADQFVLYESTLAPNGAAHDAQAVYSLNG
ncbi:RNA 2',3'-cyclic phosphodiesterase [Salinibacter grassmerensis]|uniref:RNA 2',3'-cyclic phosphodiesterase n=1 Tax=Salinibacter grassmerensis TaxID=3040353 RepID=UPI0021E94704|nr:RNA 2',3'-cyclic phosphodiesterase [Salinibacter grassmerensis]